MNNTEIVVGSRILISIHPQEKEIVKVKGVQDDNTIIVCDTYGVTRTITTRQIIKKF